MGTSTELRTMLAIQKLSPGNGVSMQGGSGQDCAHSACFMTEMEEYQYTLIKHLTIKLLAVLYTDCALPNNLTWL